MTSDCGGPRTGSRPVTSDAPNIKPSEKPQPETYKDGIRLSLNGKGWCVVDMRRTEIVLNFRQGVLTDVAFLYCATPLPHVGVWEAIGYIQSTSDPALISRRNIVVPVVFDAQENCMKDPDGNAVDFADRLLLFPDGTMAVC